MSSSSHIMWSCPACQVTITDRQKYCQMCQSMLTWTCVSSGKCGLYTNFYRQRDRCSYCTPELEPERQRIKEDNQKSRFQELEISYNGE